MKTVTSEELTQNAIREFDSATPKEKKLLIKLFGQKTFIKDIRERVKTFSDACEVLGIETDNSLSAYEKLKIIIRALNQGWKPDYSNSNQYKYYPYFRYTAGSGFSLHGVDCDGTYTSVGAPFVLETEALAKYAGTQFQTLYNEMLNF